MTVDLNRLRERWATSAFAMASGDENPDSDDLLATARAVLTAPTADVADVRVSFDRGLQEWTMTLVGVGKPPSEFADRVALVPVSGGEG